VTDPQIIQILKNEKKKGYHSLQMCLKSIMQMIFYKISKWSYEYIRGTDAF